ncbi:MAG TPA: glycosyltransferase family protein [Candidatus Limnocylindrales bacterium]|nr:glycosyltransferase family protein [Candidatus Limnocylindrales bacterium]
MPRVVAIVQARMGSTRLPGKVLLPLAGRPMVLHVAERAARIPGVDGVLVATPDGPDDAPLQDVLGANGIDWVSGPSDDVLRRYAIAAAAADADVVVRITSDCPLLSPVVSGRVVAAFLEGGADYASNTLQRTWPRGMDTEVLGREALDAVDAAATEPFEREHVTPAIWQHPERFRLRSVRGSEDLSQLRLTVDTAEDFQLVETVFETLGRDDVELDEVLGLLRRRPDLAALNAGVAQKELQA